MQSVSETTWTRSAQAVPIQSDSIVGPSMAFLPRSLECCSTYAATFTSVQIAIKFQISVITRDHVYNHRQRQRKLFNGKTSYYPFFCAVARIKEKGI